MDIYVFADLDFHAAAQRSALVRDALCHYVHMKDMTHLNG